jgi:acyl-coenzyme A synthetase/AMP-(fatty) acid ligase
VAVVLAKGAEATEEELREFAAKRLSPYKVPRRVLVLETLPRTASGKVSRLKMAEFLGLT